MFGSGEKTFTILDLFFIIMILISLAQIIISIILRHQIKSKLQKFKESVVKVEDISISVVESIRFDKNKTKPEYYPNSPNLGLAGNLILDCYSGICRVEITETREREVCRSNFNGDEDCYDEPYNYTYQSDIIDYKCSLECFESKSKECNECYSSSKYYPEKYISKKGRCSRNTNDIYNFDKYCLSDNVIYFWKGEKYEVERINRYSYLQDAMPKNVECPLKTKNCGIIDDNENKLCIDKRLDCPINTISVEKFKNADSYFTVGNKTFYYGFDENANNKKIIAGLYVDTDLYINKKEKDYTILDTYTISGVLEENKILYKGLDLGFDPYTDKNIDQKGKSYLKIKYNENKNVDIISMREKYDFYFKNKDFRDKFIKPVTDKYKMANNLSIISYSFFIVMIVILMLISFCNKSNCSFCCFFFIIFYAFINGTLFPIIKSCNDISNLNKIDKELNISSLKIVNIIYVILSFLLYGIILIFIITFCIYSKKREDLSKKEKETEKKNASDNTITNIGTDYSNTDKKI